MGAIDREYLEKSKKYIIQNLFRDKDTLEFLNSDTTDLENIWYTMWPRIKSKKSEEFMPRVFDDMKTAKRFLREIRRQSKMDWSENSHIHQMYGIKKPYWDIYEY